MERDQVTMIVQRKQARMVRPELSDGTRNYPKAVALATTDLIMPMVYVDILFAFRAPTPPVLKLEDGLAKVLCEYREWAGRLRCNDKGWSSIELSDEGVQCVEATADCSVEELMPFYPTQRLHALVPEVEGVKDPLLVQMTKFKCGGMILGIAWNHRVADGQAFIYFMEEWTRCVKGLSPTCSLSHNRSQLMAIGTATGRLQQIRDIEPTIPSSSPSVSKTRLHFTPGMLLKIKQKSTNVTLTTFAAITGHLWRCISKARRLDPEVVTCVAISIDGRGRLNPPLPESYFGNAVFVPLTISTAHDLLNNPASCPASLIQTSLAQANDQYLRESLLHIQKTVESLDQNSTMPTAAHPNLVVTSWLKFPLYEMDFGWGGPAFVGNVPRGEEGLLLLLPSYTRDGSIDAVVQLFSADLQNLEELCYNI